MSTFVKGGSTGTPFGRNEILRSTNPRPRTESFTLSAASVPSFTIDGVAGQKILQPGVAISKITAGAEAGKVGPLTFGNVTVDGREVRTNLVGINFTFLPWQLIERDVEISVIYDGALVQAWCTELNAAGTAWIALADLTATALARGGAGGKKCDISWS